MRTSFALLATSVVFFGAGLLVGRLTAPGPVLQSMRSMAETPERRDTSPLPDEPPETEAERAAELKEQLLDDWKNDPRAEIIRSLAGWSRDPTAVVGTVINGMSDDEIMMTLTSLTNLKTKDLDEVHDLHRYAQRLAEVAMTDMIGQPGFRDPELPEVYFSRDADPEQAVEVGQTEFEGNGRVHAILPMNDYGAPQVFVKWTRLDDGEVMLFDTYPIRKDSDYNWVYLEPRDGWTPGEYSVDFYSSDEAMRPLAGSNFRVR